MILYAAQGMSNDETAACLDTRREAVSLWRKHFFAERLLDFQDYWETTAHPFEGKFTRQDLGKFRKFLSKFSTQN